MDHIDRKIIDLLQNNARAPLKEIADHVFLSSPAVSARMARLESSGTITGYQAQVDACLLYTSPSPRDRQKSRMPSSA